MAIAAGQLRRQRFGGRHCGGWKHTPSVDALQRQALDQGGQVAGAFLMPPCTQTLNTSMVPETIKALM